MILIRKDQFPEGFLCEDIASVLLCIRDTHFKGSDLENIVKKSVMNQLRKGTIGLPLYNPDAKKWGQAHT